MAIQCENGELDGIKIITPFYIEDERGYFLKLVEKDEYARFDIQLDIFEEFETYSKKNVIRGLHFQTVDPQGKLVSALRGKIMDVAVDLRRDSATYGKWESIILSDINHKAFWIPAGFAHGFAVLSDDALVSYKCVGKYLHDYDTGIRWDDPDIAIEWNIPKPILSMKDKGLMSLKEFTKKYQGLTKKKECSSGGGQNKLNIVLRVAA